jgi:hemoglobin/transferrin/lactoferrin receptor protein
MDHIPPVFGQLSLMQRYKRVESEIYLMYNGAKDLKDYSPSGEDNLATATPNGMPGWVTLNVKTGIQIHRMLRLNLGIENIFDTHYRVFASGISAPGRNFVVTMRAKL